MTSPNVEDWSSEDWEQYRVRLAEIEEERKHDELMAWSRIEAMRTRHARQRYIREHCTCVTIEVSQGVFETFYNITCPIEEHHSFQ